MKGSVGSCNTASAIGTCKHVTLHLKVSSDRTRIQIGCRPDRIRLAHVSLVFVNEAPRPVDPAHWTFMRCRGTLESLLLLLLWSPVAGSTRSSLCSWLPQGFGGLCHKSHSMPCGVICLFLLACSSCCHAAVPPAHRPRPQ